jgi:hypothetical protein
MAQPDPAGKKRAGRKENPIMGTGPAADLAKELRALRDHRGLCNRELARLVPCAPSTVTVTLSGKKVPLWTTVKAIVQVCEGDMAEMEQLWLAARRPLPLLSADPAPVADVLAADPMPGGLPQERRRWWTRISTLWLHWCLRAP